jgi:hypothetical protein
MESDERMDKLQSNELCWNQQQKPLKPINKWSYNPKAKEHQTAMNEEMWINNAMNEQNLQIDYK